MRNLLIPPQASEFQRLRTGCLHAQMRESCGTVVELKNEDAIRNMKRNIMIIGVPDSPVSCTPTGLAKMLTEALQLRKLTLIDHVYWTPGRRSSDNKSSHRGQSASSSGLCGDITSTQWWSDPLQGIIHIHHRSEATPAERTRCPVWTAFSCTALRLSTPLKLRSMSRMSFQ